MHHYKEMTEAVYLQLKLNLILKRLFQRKHYAHCQQRSTT